MGTMIALNALGEDRDLAAVEEPWSDPFVLCRSVRLRRCHRG